MSRRERAEKERRGQRAGATGRSDRERVSERAREEAGRGRTEPEHTECAPNTVISAARARVFERGIQSESQSKVIGEVGQTETELSWD